MLENQVEGMYNAKKEEYDLNYLVREKENFFSFVHKSMMTDSVVAVLTGIAAIAAGSSMPAIQQDDPSLVGAYILGALAFAGASVCSGISALYKKKQLKSITKEIDDVESNSNYDPFLT